MQTLSCMICISIPNNNEQNKYMCTCNCQHVQHCALLVQVESTCLVALATAYNARETEGGITQKDLLQFVEKVSSNTIPLWLYIYAFCVAMAVACLMQTVYLLYVVWCSKLHVHIQLKYLLFAESKVVCAILWCVLFFLFLFLCYQLFGDRPVSTTGQFKIIIVWATLCHISVTVVLIVLIN